MAEHSADKFDFDDWAGLYIENPQEFEARRSTALMMALMRGSPENYAAGRAMLDAYEKRVEGCDPQERFQVAASMMAESASQLRTELLMLKHTLENIEEEETPIKLQKPEQV